MKTNREIIQFINFAQSWLGQHGEKESKFKYAVTRALKRCMSAHEKMQDELEDINIEFCSVDDRGNILRDERNQYRFTKDMMVARLKAQRELMKKAVPFEPYIATEPPPVPLVFEEVELCTGFVLNETPQLEVVANG